MPVSTHMEGATEVTDWHCGCMSFMDLARPASDTLRAFMSTCPGCAAEAGLGAGER